MFRKVIAVVAGLITGFLVVFIGDATAHRLYPLTVNPDDREAFNAFVMSMPMYVFVIMLLFWLLAAFLGSLVTALITRPQWLTPSMITTAILLAATLTNLAFVQHPTWMIVAALVLFLPAGYAGAWLVGRRKETLPAP